MLEQDGTRARPLDGRQVDETCGAAGHDDAAARQRRLEQREEVVRRTIDGRSANERLRADRNHPAQAEEVRARLPCE